VLVRSFDAGEGGPAILIAVADGEPMRGWALWPNGSSTTG